MPLSTVFIVIVAFATLVHASSTPSSALNGTGLQEVARAHKKESDGGGIMSMIKKFAPMMAIPMTLQALAVPFQLGAVYLMLFYSVLIGKIAVTLMVANQIKQNSINAELYKPLVHQHYGYDGSEEYGAWIS